MKATTSTLRHCLDHHCPPILKTNHFSAIGKRPIVLFHTLLATCCTSTPLSMNVRKKRSPPFAPLCATRGRRWEGDLSQLLDAHSGRRSLPSSKIEEYLQRSQRRVQLSVQRPVARHPSHLPRPFLWLLHKPHMSILCRECQTLIDGDGSDRRVGSSRDGAIPPACWHSGRGEARGTLRVSLRGAGGGGGGDGTSVAHGEGVVIRADQ